MKDAIYFLITFLLFLVLLSDYRYSKISKRLKELETLAITQDSLNKKLVRCVEHQTDYIKHKLK